MFFRVLVFENPTQVEKNSLYGIVIMSKQSATPHKEALLNRWSDI